jgi:hypothetical protein
MPAAVINHATTGSRARRPRSGPRRAGRQATLNSLPETPWAWPRQQEPKKCPWGHGIGSRVSLALADMEHPSFRRWHGAFGLQWGARESFPSIDSGPSAWRGGPRLGPPPKWGVALALGPWGWKAFPCFTLGPSRSMAMTLRLALAWVPGWRWRWGLRP